jgi:TP901 family phage tail tape measure protein
VGAEVADLFTILRAETAPFSRGLRTAAEEGESFSARMGGLRQTMVKLGAATSLVAVGFAVYGVKAAGDFQQKMNLLVTACGESTQNLKKVSDGVLSLARQTGTSTSELADGMYQVEKAGHRGADGLTVLKAAAQGAREEGASLKDVTNAMTSVMTSYHLKATDSVRVMNALKTAAGEGKMTMEEFSRSLSTVIPIASANKVSFAEVGGAIATLTQHGTSAQEATQELSNTIRSLAAPNNVAVQQMQRLGLSSVDVATHLGKRGLTGTLDLLSQTVLSKMGKSGTVLLSTFNDTKQASADLKQMLGSMPKTVQGLATSLQNGSTTLGDYKLAMKGLPADQAAMGLQFLTLYQRSHGFNDALKRGGPAALTYTDAIKKMTGGATGLNTTLQLTGENADGFKDRVKKVGTSLSNASKDVEGWDVTQKSFNVQMGRLKEAVVTAAITIGLKLIPVILAIINFFEQHRSACIALAIVIGTVLVTAVVAFTISLWNMAAAAWATGIPELILLIVAIVVGLVLLIRHWGEVWAAVKSATKATLDWIVDRWHWLRDQTVDAWHAVGRALTDAWRAVAAFFVTGWHMVVDPIVAAWNWCVQVTATVWNGITAFFRKWWPLLLVIFALPIAILLATWNHFHTQILAVVQAVWNAVLTALKAIWSGIQVAASAAWRGIQIVIINPIVSAWHTLQSVWKTIAGWLSTAWSGIRSVAVSIWGRISSAMTGPINSARSTISSTVGKVKSTISSGFTGAYNAVKGIGGKFVSVGEGIVTGILRGIGNSGGLIGNKLKSLAEGALSSAKSFLGIGSPSKAFADQVGQWIPAGIAMGVNDNAHLAHRSVTDMAAGTISAFSTELEINSPSKKFAALGAYVMAGLVSGLTGSTARVRAATEHIARSLYTDFGSGHKGLQKLVAKDNSQLMQLAKNRDSVVTKLKAAQKKLADVQKAWTDEKNSVASSIMQSASVITQSPDEGRAVNANDVVEQMRDKVQQATQFAAELEQLRKKGLRSDLIQQLAAAGADQGGATALALAGASQGQIQQMNQMQSNLQTAANATGTAVADAMYGAGLKSAQGLVKGLQSQEAAIEKQMLKIALAMQAAIKKALGIKSPSRVFAALGEFIPQGLAQGIQDATHHATSAIAGMAGAVAGGMGGAALASGGGGGTVINNLTVQVTGSVLTEKKLVDVVQAGMLKMGARNSTTYPAYKR